MYVYIYIYIYIYVVYNSKHITIALHGAHDLALLLVVRPVHLLRVSLLRVLESNFPEDSL